MIWRIAAYILATLSMLIFVWMLAQAEWRQDVFFICMSVIGAAWFCAYRADKRGV